jgi:hypothetical protein
MLKSLIVAPIEEKNVFWDRSTKPKIGILQKLMCLEASTKPHVHNLIHEYLINMAFKVHSGPPKVQERLENGLYAFRG